MQEDNDTTATTRPAPSPESSHVEFAEPEVLLVDDQPARLLTYESILSGVGVRCVRALSGPEALQLLLQQSFALIVLDVSMPGMDGFEVARLVRSHPRSENTPIIFVTGVHISELDQLRGYEVGAIDYIAVPIVPEILRSKVALLVELYRRRAELEVVNRQLQATRAQLEEESRRALEQNQSLLLQGEERYRSLFDAAQAEREWLTALLNSMTDEVYFADPEGRYTYANPAALREFALQSVQQSKVEDIVRSLEVFRPDGTRRPYSEAPPLRALAGEEVRGEEHIVRTPRTGQLRQRQVSAAPVRDSAGRIIGSVSVVRDVTDQRRIDAALRLRDARSSALLSFSDRLRSLGTVEESIAFTTEFLGSALKATRCGYGSVDPDNELLTVESEWHAEGVTPLAGTLHFRRYGSHIDELKAGQTVVCADASVDVRTEAVSTAVLEVQARAFVNIPIVEAGRLVAVLYVTDAVPRAWLAADVSFIREVADRSHASIQLRRREQSAATDLKLTVLLRDLAARLIGEGDVQVLFEDVLDAALTITQAQAGTLHLWKENAKALLPRATRSSDPALIAHLQGLPPERIAAVDLASQVPTLTQCDSSPTDEAARLHLKLGLQSALTTPLRGRTGRLVGVLTTYWNTGGQLTQRERHFLDLLARQAADLIDRTQAEQQLRESDRAKDEFIAILAHELRNPLVPIRTGIELLRRVKDGGDTLEAVRPMMERQVAHMVRLIDDLLDVSRITSGKIELKVEPASVESVISNAVDANRSAFAASQLNLKLNIERPDWIVRLDRTRVAQVVANLLQNAIQFTPAGGHVTVEARVLQTQRGAEELLIEVSDDGIGISENMLERVFDLFVQSGAPLEGRSRGLGIGLALARRLVQMHGGSISAFSAGPGLGSRFSVRLPAPRFAAVSSPPTPEPVSLAGIRVLVVDDNRDAANALHLLVESAGAIVTTAYSGEAALDILQGTKQDVILLDIGLPGMDGYEVCRRIRAVFGDRVVLIGISGWGQERDKQRALQAGFNVHLTKPVDPRQLELAIATLRLPPGSARTTNNL
ncbi:MAG TPA: response regulator [Steroidobacteraceae bacterium]|nr:response regulator [Steroidobacteraceae bacterium]